LSLPVIPPGSRLGILGGGQLGRMTAMAAARLGYRTVVLAPDEDCIAAAVADAHIRADYADQDALARLAEAIDVVTIEFENVPADALRWLRHRVPTRPHADILEITQDRLREKTFVSEAGIAVTPFRAVSDEAGLRDARDALGADAILKTRRLGYDGKGQLDLRHATDDAAALDAIGRAPAIVEARVAFAAEVSVVTARGANGAVASYPPVENRHRDHILDETIAPAELPRELAVEAVWIAETLASKLELVGLLAVEMFVTTDRRLLVNELAPRPHNSGHWSIDACAVSQFEQLVRAVCGLPLGDPSVYRPARMKNLIGREVEAWPELLGDPKARLHIYGKKTTRAGRKMGHVTWVD